MLRQSFVLACISLLFSASAFAVTIENKLYTNIYVAYAAVGQCANNANARLTVAPGAKQTLPAGLPQKICVWVNLLPPQAVSNNDYRFVEVKNNSGCTVESYYYRRPPVALLSSAAAPLAKVSLYGSCF